MASTYPTDLRCSGIFAALSIPHSNLLAVASSDSTVRVYKHDTDGNSFLKFERHLSPVVGLILLDDDIVASIDSEGNLFTWNATNGIVLDNTLLSPPGLFSYRIKRLSSTTIAVKSIEARISIVNHILGRDLFATRVSNEKIDAFRSICVHDGKRFAVSGRKNCIRVQIETGNKFLYSIRNSDSVECIAVNDKFIVVACLKGEIFLRRNGGNYAIIHSRHLRTWIPKFNPSPGKIQAVSFVSSSVLMLNTLNEGIFFLSVPNLDLLGRIGPRITGYSKCYTAIMGDTRICIGSKEFCCVLDLPPQVRSHIQRFRERGDPAPIIDQHIEGGDTHGPIQNYVDPAKNDIMPSVTRKRNREESGGVEVVDLTGESSKNTAGVESQRSNSAIEVAEQVFPNASLNKKRDDVRKGVKKAKLQLEEQKKERESLKVAADVRVMEMEKMHLQMEKNQKKIEKLKKKVLQHEEERQARASQNLAKRDEMARMQSELDDLRTVVKKLLFKIAARGEK